MRKLRASIGFIIIMNNYPPKRAQGFLMFSVVILFFVLTVLCSLVLAAFARANEQLLVAIKHHQLEQAAISSIAALKVHDTSPSCQQDLLPVQSVKAFEGIDLRVDCTNAANSTFIVNVTARWPNPSKLPLRMQYQWTMHEFGGDI